MATEALKQFELISAGDDQRYRRLLNAISDYTYTVYIKDNQPVKTEHRGKCLDITGYTPEEFNSDIYLWIKMVYPEDIRRVQDRVSKIISGETPPPIEHRITRKDGAIRWIRNSSVVYRDAKGNPLYYDGVIEDITDRKVSESFRSLLASIVSSSSEGFISFDLNGAINSWNKGAEIIFGHREAGVLGKTISILQSSENRLSELLQAVENVKKNPVEQTLETPFVRKNGIQLDLSFTISPLMNVETGTQTGMFIVVRDITETKRMQKYIVSVSDDALKQIGRDLHDGLCQELAGISFMCQMLSTKMGPKKAEGVNEIGQITTLVNNVVKEIRNISRGLVMDDLDLIGLESAIRTLAKDTEDLYVIPCSFEYDPSPEFKIFTHRRHLFRIAQEAVHNAAKHSKAKKIAIRLSVKEGRIILTVDDDGIGIAEDYRDKGMGMKNMRFRSTLMNARFDVLRKEGGGTLVTCSAPTE